MCVDTRDAHGSHAARTDRHAHTAIQLIRYGRITRRLNLSDNQSLRRIDGLGRLASAEEIIINDNPQLESIRGFDVLTSTGRIQIRNNELLSIVDFGSLERVTNEIRIESNATLRIPGNFQRLEHIENRIT